MKVKTKIIILSVLFFALVAIIVYGMITGEETIKSAIAELAVAAASFAGVIVRILWGRRRGHRPLSFYEVSYQRQIEHAFEDDDKKRKMLLKALRLYDEDKCKKSIKLLKKLEKECATSYDRCAVGLFLARNYTDLKNYGDAYNKYKELIERLDVNESVYNNMGYLAQEHFSDLDTAFECYKKALDINPKHAYTYNNIAQIYFDWGEWAAAEDFAKRALEFNPKVHQAASLLAIIYSCTGAEEEADKYFAIAIRSGKNKAELMNSIKYYKERQ
ncbi:MAG: tetratricopeptide repeat protein [Clostridia bacterium]|nr:tetratricopeptide repeat protein [Clostridia bacterium]